ncbi:MAG: GNAT family N-acetyltransferase [Rhodocyclaceae bacterium]|nr:MAG: GNAT family N-acetyltransferase [Rhodocyclaceae bacterium]MBE7422120.1 GNAT family N-acetyltransferase [Zoogloeaceae bacterium]MCK6383537.1 GNAT family N-acetyltransferase [Rhodocyclaceae bacterium]CAG0927081.1 diamine N-acetyltransferase [Rhodocyclaceae bacterium]
MAVQVNVRMIRGNDLDSVVAIDKLITGQERREYYQRKLEQAVDNRQNVNASLAAEVGGKMVGFMMGDVFFGEYGIPDASATVDTIGVHPEFQKHGVASELMDQFLMNMKAANVKKIYTLVNWNDFALEGFFARHKFQPSKRISLELQLP